VTTSTEAAAGDTPAARGSKKVYNRVWFKVYGADLLTDPRIALMTDAQFRVWIGILALANDTLAPGFVTFGTPAIALMLRRPQAEVEDCMSRLADLKLVRSTSGGTEILNGHRFYSGAGLNYGDSAEGATARKRAQRARARLKPQDGCHSAICRDTPPENENSEVEGRSPEPNETVSSLGDKDEPGVRSPLTLASGSLRSGRPAPVLDLG